MAKSEVGRVTLDSLSEDDLSAINALVDSQYAPKEQPPENLDDDPDNNVPVPWRERDGGQYPYLVRGAHLRCWYGSHIRKLNLPRSHGDYIGEDPTMNANDCKPGQADTSGMVEGTFFGSVGNALGGLFGGKKKTESSSKKMDTIGTDFNIAPFGVCQSPDGPKGVGTILLKSEKANPVTGIPYEGKIEDNVKGPPCTPIIVGQWQNPHFETKIGAADETPYEAITQGSFLVCKHCGVIEPLTSGQPELEPAMLEYDNSGLLMAAPLSVSLDAEVDDDKSGIVHGIGKGIERIAQQQMGAVAGVDAGAAKGAVAGVIAGANKATSNSFKGTGDYIDRYPKEYIDGIIKAYETHKMVDGRFVLDNGGQTIGYGHDILPGEDFSKGLSQQEALDLAIKDLNKAYEEKVVARVNSLNNDFGYSIDINKFSENELIFLIDFAYNRGVGLVERRELKDVGKPSTSLALLIIAVNEKNDSKINEVLMEETKNLRGVYYEGLELRRMDQFEILRFGDYVRDYDINRDFTNPQK